MDAETDDAAAWRVIVEYAPDAILLLDRDLRCITLSAGAVAMFGYAAAEVLGESIGRFLDPEDLAGQPLRVERLRNGETVISERKLQRKDGMIVEIESSARRLPDGRTIVVARDITTRRKTEDARRVAEERLRLFGTATDGLYDEDLRSNSLWRSDSVRSLLGRDDLGGSLDDRGWLSVVHPDDASEVRETLQRALAVGQTFWEAEYRLRKADGTFIWVRDKAQILRDEAGLPVRIVGAIADITERKNAEAALRDSEERFRALIENTADIFAIIDAEGILRYQSPSYELVLGYGPNELVGRNAFERVHPRDIERIAGVFREGIATPGIVVRDEFRYLHKDGTWRDLEVTAQNMIDHPAIAGAVITSRDVTKRKATERQLEQVERLSAIGRLAGTVAHEFNNVLMSIQPFAELIQRLSDDPKLVESAGQITRAVQRGKRVTHDILRFTRRGEPVLAPLDATSWLRTAVGSAAPFLPNNVEVDVEAPEVSVMVLADEGQLSQVLTNLLMNAAEALPAGGKVRARLWLPESDLQPFGALHNARDHVILTIEDEGHGIDPENLGRVFEPLFTTKPNRTGLGLAVAHQIIRAHGGQIFVESRTGSGAAFHLVLAKPKPATERAVETEALTPATRSGATRILLVEDEAPIAEGIAALLELDGFDVQIATTGTSGIAALRSGGFDLVVLDVGLPDMSGMDAYETIAAEWPALPVVFSTGHGAELETGRGGTTPVRFLRKPYAHEDLVAAIRQLRYRPA